MESSSGRFAEEQRKQAEIRRQIALLQSQLVDLPEETAERSRSISASIGSPKRKEPEDVPLVPSTPSPKKRKMEPKSKGPTNHHLTKVHGSTSSISKSAMASGSKVVADKPQDSHYPPKPAPSTLLSRLASLNSCQEDSTSTEYLNRSSAFSDTPGLQRVSNGPMRDDDTNLDGDAPQRDDRLALVEDIEIGPYDHKPPFDDPHFEGLEPNSGIRLSSRIISHSDLQEYLSGRYYLSPSRLYSAIRLLPDKQGYDVPVDGDWVTIAVVAERGPIKHTKAPVGIGREDGNGHDGGKTDTKLSKRKQKADSAPKPSGKKYVNIKLIDFGSRSRSSSSATGGKAVIRGDAFLSLLLFESDGFDRITGEDGTKSRKVYKGGSRGAFETLSKVKEGDVIALLNPKILKPFQRSTDTPHPTSNILALAPESASSIAIIGRSRDLGMCTVTKRDGKPCGSWFDKRASEVCEWHVQNAVQHRRAGRAEFSIGTSGMSTTAAPKRKPAYDPARQWGLKPSETIDSSGGATYVVSGHIVSGSGSGPDSSSLFVAETMGREGQAKATRKMGTKDSDRALKALLDRDKEGMKAVIKAREAGKKRGERDARRGKGNKNCKGKGDQKASSDEADRGSEVGIGMGAKHCTPNTEQKAYSAAVIKNLGFDPTLKPGQRRPEDSTVQKKLEALAALQSSRKEIVLGPRPGQRIRSGVFAPSKISTTHKASTSMPTGILPPLESSDEELDHDPAILVKSMSTAEKMIDLDGSSDCEIER